MKLIHYTEVENRFGIITLNDPDVLNAMSEEMAVQFEAELRLLEARKHELRVLILTGAGKAFSAGGSLQMLEEKKKLSGEENRMRMLSFYRSFLNILKLEIPLIAAINGAAIGAGLCLACACDIRIAAVDAKLGFTFAKLGLHPGMGATYFLPRIVSPSLASELLLTARVVTAEEALRLGLVSKTCPKENVMDEALVIAREISLSGKESIRQLLFTLRNNVYANLDEALEREALCQSLSYASEEFALGLQTVQKSKF
jgi:enoyl-CoA hydratase/carnithine racemase